MFTNHCSNQFGRFFKKTCENMKKSLQNKQSKLVIISSGEDCSEEEECRDIKKQQLRKKQIQPIILSSDEENVKKEELVGKKKTLGNKENQLILVSSDEDKDEKKEIDTTVVKEKKKNVGEDAKDVTSKKKVDVKRNVKKDVKKTLKRTIKDVDETLTTNLNKKKRKLEEDVSNKNIGISTISMECVEWTEIDYICEVQNIGKQQAENIVKLFRDENTIPFIARYRKNVTGGMEADQLRLVKECFDRANAIKHRTNTIIKAIDKLGKWTPQIHAALLSTKCEDDLEYIYSMFKDTSKQSLAERAKSIGLGPISNAIIKGDKIPPLVSLINKEKKGLQTEQQIIEGIVHIIADIISKDKAILDKVKMLEKKFIMDIHTAPLKMRNNSKDIKKEKSADIKKYEIYLNFKSNTRDIKPYQILAINRAESQKVLAVKILIPDRLEDLFISYCIDLFHNAFNVSISHSKLLKDSMDYAFKRYIKPLIIRKIRRELKERADNASIEVFATNVKQLLLTPPVRGKVVLGIDPGFIHGCKLAVVSEQGNVLETAIIYPHKKGKDLEKSRIILIDLVKKYHSTVVALGNGKACRETEQFLSDLIQSKAFKPLDVSYTIVNESGASIYSCSSEATLEFGSGQLDPNIISAISIARRLQDPLAELVKIEPKHLGVGMYQHDLPEKQLMQSLNEVVTEVVSFVGVDINTASHSLLTKVAGLNKSKATNIIKWRNTEGPFLNRKQLLKVKGIGGKTFEQCAGFIRILPETVVVAGSQINQSKDPNESLNFLDQTWIHPESYSVAYQFLKLSGCNVAEIGSLSFIETIKAFAEKNGPNVLTQLLTDEDTLQVIITGLTMKKDEDIRIKFHKPLFRSSLQNIKDLTNGTLLSGAVRNVTDFGVFVDVGLNKNGLMPASLCKGQTFYVGQHVEVRVVNIDYILDKFCLEFVRSI